MLIAGLALYESVGIREARLGGGWSCDVNLLWQDMCGERDRECLCGAKNVWAVEAWS